LIDDAGKQEEVETWHFESDGLIHPPEDADEMKPLMLRMLALSLKSPIVIASVRPLVTT
jgi:hypothetical protein